MDVNIHQSGDSDLPVQIEGHRVLGHISVGYEADQPIDQEQILPCSLPRLGMKNLHPAKHRRPAPCVSLLAHL